MSAFKVRGFATAPESLLMETVHRTETSAALEVEAWQSRMRRGEVSRAELIDMRPQGTLTNLRIYEHTEIPWSWTKMSPENAAIYHGDIDG